MYPGWEGAWVENGKLAHVRSAITDRSRYFKRARVPVSSDWEGRGGRNLQKLGSLLKCGEVLKVLTKVAT